MKGLLTLDSLSADSIQVETARIDILQDTTAVTFGSFVKFPDQERFDGFSANLDGYVKMDQIMATVRHRDSKGDTGLNLGMLVNFTDSGYIGKLIPEKPILAYDSYQLNDDNVVILDTLNRLFATCTCAPSPTVAALISQPTRRMPIRTSLPTFRT